MPALTIELYADIGCPWCFIATWRTAAVLAELGRENDTQFLHQPFVVDPTIPPEGRDILKLMQERYGGVPPALAVAEAEARLSGVPFLFENQPIAYPTAKAQTLLRHANTRGVQTPLAKALYLANFVDGANIADTGVLARIAARHGFSEAEAAALVENAEEVAVTLKQSDHARALGVRSVPTYVFNGAMMMQGTQTEASLREVIERVRRDAA